MMNSCDKSSAFSLDPHLKAVSYFIFRLCIPSYRKQKKNHPVFYTMLHLHNLNHTSPQEVKKFQLFLYT